MKDDKSLYMRYLVKILRFLDKNIDLNNTIKNLSELLKAEHV